MNKRITILSVVCVTVIILMAAKGPYQTFLYPSSELVDERSIYFVRSGIWLEGIVHRKLKFVLAEEGQSLKKRISKSFPKGYLIQVSWIPGARYQLEIQSSRGNQSSKHTLYLQAPLQPAPCAVSILDMERILPFRTNDFRSNQASFVKFSPNGQKLAIGTQHGVIKIIETLTGEVIFEKRITEGHAKSACFSADGKKLFVGEQSPDAYIYAFNIKEEKELWRFRLADDLESSVPNVAANNFAWAQLPGVYRIVLTAKGDVLALGVHSWTKDGKAVSQSRLYSIDANNGHPLWSYPEKGPMPLSIPWFDVSRSGHRLAFISVLGFMTEGPPGNDTFKPGTLHFLNSETGKRLWAYQFEPLRPYFKRVEVWRSVGVSPDGAYVCATTQDGRGYIFNTIEMESGARLQRRVWTGNLAMPLDLNGAPVVATTGALAATSKAAIFIVGNSFVPIHTEKGTPQMSQLHPSENQLLMFRWNSPEVIWKWRPPNVPSGIRLSRNETNLVMTLSRSGNHQRGQVNGFQLFNMRQAEKNRYVYEYRTEGPIAYDQFDISPNGEWIALVEIPVKSQDNTTTIGKYRLHLVH